MTRVAGFPVQLVADVLVALLWSDDRKRARQRRTA